VTQPAQKFTEWLAQHRNGVADAELSEMLRAAFAAELDRLGVLLAATIDAPPILFGAS
jgi:hypothetical protein